MLAAPDAAAFGAAGRESSPAYLGSGRGWIGQLPGQEAGASARNQPVVWSRELELLG